MNLTEVFQRSQMILEEDVVIQEDMIPYKTIVSPPIVKLQISHMEKGKAMAKGTGELSFRPHCDRCLEETELKLSVEFERILYSPEVNVDEDTREEQYFLDGYELDVQTMILEELQLIWPTKILCKEDCKGICKKCGTDLNKGSCDCDDFVPDVRFANLMDIFNNSQ